MRKFLGIIITVFLALLLLGKCASAGEETYDIESEIAKIKAEGGFDSPTLEPTDEGFIIPAPSDTGATYRILKISKRNNGNLEVLSRRDGSSGTSFARREISCAAYTYRYLGEGDTQIEAEKDGSNPGNMSALTGTSASSDVANAACKKDAK